MAYYLNTSVQELISEFASSLALKDVLRITYDVPKGRELNKTCFLIW
ncbi:MAG: hypothetical protein ACJA0J_001182 [Bdellovibrionota bacterium]|jgi:hypothetical protein